MWKKILIWGGLVAVCYFLLAYHYIIYGNRFKPLKKSRLSLSYTFVSIDRKSNKAIMAIDELREAGIADLLMKIGKMSEAERDKILEKYEPDYDYY